ncbi:hypothetical protein BH24ACT7_BH24ACT7_20070 [soil metagenome]
MDAEVLAVQEVESIAVLREFNTDHLGGIYRYAALVEGNDPRFIDVGVLSRLPLGAVTSHQNRVHPASPAVPVSSRDLLEVEVLNGANGDRMVTLYVNHLKSKFVPFPQDPIAGGAAADPGAASRPRASRRWWGSGNAPTAASPYPPLDEGSRLTRSDYRGRAHQPNVRSTTELAGCSPG